MWRGNERSPPLDEDQSLSQESCGGGGYQRLSVCDKGPGAIHAGHQQRSGNDSEGSAKTHIISVRRHPAAAWQAPALLLHTPGPEALFIRARPHFTLALMSPDQEIRSGAKEYEMRLYPAPATRRSLRSAETQAPSSSLIRPSLSLRTRRRGASDTLHLCGVSYLSSPTFPSVATSW